MVFKLNLIALKLVQEEAFVDLLQSYHDMPDIALYSYFYCAFESIVLSLNCNIQYVGINFVLLVLANVKMKIEILQILLPLWYFLEYFFCFSYTSQDKQSTYQISLSQFPLGIVVTMKVFNRMIRKGGLAGDNDFFKIGAVKLFKLFGFQL